MKKIKELWNNNRIMVVLGTVVIICFIIMAVVLMNLFFGVNTSAYGDRLNDINDKPFTDEMKTNIENKLKENEVVNNVSVRSQGKIIYIRIEFKNVSLDRAKEIAGSTVELISEEYRKLYDIHYTLVQEKTENSEGFIIMGSKNISGNSTIIWNNNTPYEITSDEE